jgi:hypothetical protein
MTQEPSCNGSQQEKQLGDEAVLRQDKLLPSGDDVRLNS